MPFEARALGERARARVAGAFYERAWLERARARVAAAFCERAWLLRTTPKLGMGCAGAQEEKHAAAPAVHIRYVGDFV
jgi:hypothetical protein